MQKYPFMLYAGGDRDGEHRVAEDEGQEAALRADGFKGLADEPDGDAVKAAAAKNDKATKAKNA